MKGRRLFVNISASERQELIDGLTPDERVALLQRMDGLRRDLDAAARSLRSARNGADEIAAATMEAFGFGDPLDASVRSVWKKLDPVLQQTIACRSSVTHICDALAATVYPDTSKSSRNTT